MTNRQLSVLLVLLLLGGVVLGADTLVRGPSEVERQLVELFEEQQDVLAEQAAMRIWDSLREIEVRLSTTREQALAANVALHTPAQINQTLARIAHPSDAERGIALAVLDNQGRLLAATGHVDVDSFAALEARVEKGEPASDDNDVKIYRQGLFDEGDRIAASRLDEQHVLAASVDLDTLAARIFEQVTGPRNTHAGLLDANGQPIYSRDTTQLSEQSAWVTGTARVPNTGLTVEISAPRSVIAPEVDEQVRAAALRGLGVLGLFLASMGIVVALFRRQQRARVTQTRALAHQDKLATLGLMAASTAHEIRNAIAVADLQLQVAAANADTQTSGHIDKASESVHRLAELAASLSRFGGRDPQVDQRFELSAAVDEALRVVDPKLGRNIELDVRADDDLFVFGSQGAIVQVIVNLVLNAFDAVQSQNKSGQVTIRTWGDGDDAVVSVADNGEGIAPEALNKIFEPFFSTKSGEENSGGTGIGLWLCSQIIEQHDGTISAENVESGGARFLVRLPVADVEPTSSHDTT